MSSPDAIMTKIRLWRSKKLEPIGRFLIKLKLSANGITTFSLISGLLAIYFLFTSTLFFIIFALLHLLADAFDGIVARIQGSTNFGLYFDHLTDRTIELLLLIKIALHLQDYYVYIVIVLFLLAQMIYLLSKLQAPILYTRTLIMIILAFNLPTIAYLTTGVASIFSLARQLQWYVPQLMIKK